MNIGEIFAMLSARLVEGMMYHDQMSRYYGFLGLFGYRAMHDHHYQEETDGYRKLNAYYSDHYCKLIPNKRVADPKKIPEGWLPHSRRDVDLSTKKKAIQTGAEGWVEWEVETRSIFMKCAKELFDSGEMASYAEVMEYVRDVDCELSEARKELLILESTGYDLSFIMDRQEAIKEDCLTKVD